LIYNGIGSPSTMVLEDSLDNIGCAARDSVQSVGNDLVFLSNSGLMTLGRALVSENNPVGGISNNVRTDLIQRLSSESLPIKSVYSPEQAFYLISFPTTGIVYCFDMRGDLEDGAHRATTWSIIDPMCFHRCTSVTNNGQLRMGMVKGISTYTGYNDDASSTYTMSYVSNPMDFDSPANLKFLKKIVTTVVGQAGTTVSVKWGYDYTSTFKSQTLTLANVDLAEFGLAEFGLAEFTTGFLLNKTRNNADGSGINVSVGLDAVINGALLSIQQLDIHALLGRIY
jgi:hypothetical protein